MYASNLQSLLLRCCERSDLSHEDAADYVERFSTLRSYGHLPRGRDKRNHSLSPQQIAAAILGLVPARPAWAGHAATVLKTFSPVGGPRASFFNSVSLVDATVLLLTDAEARESLIALRVVLGETGANSAGGAVIVYEYKGARKYAFFMSKMAISLARENAELSFDFEKHLFSPASREMSFGNEFFQRIAREMEIAARTPGRPEGDGTEYDDEETKQVLWKKLGVTPQSRFLTLAADNHVTWPREPTLVRFDGHHFILMPRTRDHVQSVHVDLTANKLRDSEAMTVVRRFLSIMAWCDNNFATLGRGWSGSPVPVAVSNSGLGFKTASHYIFDRKSPVKPEARRALALYREALNAEHNGLISYAVLNYYKIVELTQPHAGATKNWFRDNFEYVRQIDELASYLSEFDKLRGGTKPHQYIHDSCRIAVAHAGKHSKSDPDDASELRRLHVAAEIMQSLARHFIDMNFNISDCMFDGT